MTDMSISEVSAQTGLRTSTLRYYEEIGLLNPTGRVSGKRHYDEGVLQRLALIQTGQQAGFTLAELGTLLNHVLDSGEGGAEWQALMTRKLKEMDARLRNIHRMKNLLEDIMDCDDATLAECIVLTGQKYRTLSPVEE